MSYILNISEQLARYGTDFEFVGAKEVDLNFLRLQSCEAAQRSRMV